MYKILEKILNILLNIIIVIVVMIVIIVGYNYIQLEIMDKDYTNLFGYTVFEVTTGSMAKTLNVYDLILVKITKEVEQGDIVTFKQDDEIITHRIMQINGDELITKGDANNVEDKMITKEAIIGKVVFVYPKFGIWSKVLSEPRVLISIFITLFLLGQALNKEEKNVRKEKEEEE